MRTKSCIRKESETWFCFDNKGEITCSFDRKAAIGFGWGIEPLTSCKVNLALNRTTVYTLIQLYISRYKMISMMKTLPVLFYKLKVLQFLQVLNFIFLEQLSHHYLFR